MTPVEPFGTYGPITLYRGDCRDILSTLPDNSIGGCACDPPYELGFMGKGWDGSGIAYDVKMWAALYRVLKPGAYLAAFGGSRTYHRMACAIEDAGFTIRDSLHWHYGSGFPKSHNISKAIDKSKGAKRDKKKIANPHNNKGATDTRPYIERAMANGGYHEIDDDTPITELAIEWQGYGTALKPGHEPIVLAQKPLDGTYAQNVEKWGVGALNIDKCRIGTGDHLQAGGRKGRLTQGDTRSESGVGVFGGDVSNTYEQSPEGRWPPNVLFTHSLFCTPMACDPSCPVGQLDKQSGVSKGRKRGVMNRGAESGTSIGGDGRLGTAAPHTAIVGYGDSKGASAFFPILDWSEDDYWWLRYTAKPTTKERNDGTIDPDTGEGGNTHVTVKPLAVMAWLLDLIIPKGQTAIDPFAGSGTTLCAARQRKIPAIGIEMDQEHCEIIAERLGANTIKGWE